MNSNQSMNELTELTFLTDLICFSLTYFPEGTVWEHFDFIQGKALY